MSSSRKLTIFFFVLALPLLVDRVVLFIWSVQVIRLYRSLDEIVKRSEQNPPKSRFGYVSFGLEPLLIMPKSNQWPARQIER